MTKSEAERFDTVPVIRPIAPFEGPKLKVDNARRHLATLKRQVAEYWSGEPVKIVVEEASHNPGGPMVYWRAHVNPLPPVELSCIFGDAIHNLRSSLDLLAGDLVRREGKSDNGVYFPFAHSKEKMREQIKRSRFNRAGKTNVERIKALRPWRDGALSLRALHDLDIQDKHRMIVPSVAGAEVDLPAVMSHEQPDPTGKLAEWRTTFGDGYILFIIARRFSPPLGTVIPARYWLLVHADDLGYGMTELISELCTICDGLIDAFENSPPGERWDVK